MLEDSVKMLQSPVASSVAALSRPKAEKALALLPDWIFESGGAVSFSALRHPSSKLSSTWSASPLPPSVLSLPPSSKPDTSRLARTSRPDSATPPSSNSLQTTLLTARGEPRDYAEELLCVAIAKLSDSCIERCADVIVDRFNINSLRDLENRGGERMVNVSCQLQAFNSLLLDFARHLPAFSRTSEKCLKLADFNTRSRIRSIFLKHQHKESGYTRLLRNHRSATDFAVLEDVMSFMRPIQMVILDDDCKLVGTEEAFSLTEVIQDSRFWTELEAIQSLVTLVKTMARAMETEQPSIGQCLTLWDELRSKIREWRAKFNNCDGDLVDELIEKRFEKNYRSAWAAAFMLDPLFLIRDSSGNYLPPFNRLSPEQDKDANRVVAQLVPAKDAPLALMELMKWRS
ncbi:hypothetical protein ZIOFF_035843 [Zingiber officinale]|uniref:Uncharacterized protein n=1 Tax=Zingiber officinale TaxID=94328 RepID=A0A8J5KY16_ZINOF|nr:hypothetical protein ZIOFF_035843 [Zingiber officinale]